MVYVAYLGGAYMFTIEESSCSTVRECSQRIWEKKLLLSKLPVYVPEHNLTGEFWKEHISQN